MFSTRGVSCLLNSDTGSNNAHTRRHTLDVRDVREEQAGSTSGRQDKILMIVTNRVVSALFPQPTLKDCCSNEEVQERCLFSSMHVDSFI